MCDWIETADVSQHNGNEIRFLQSRQAPKNKAHFSIIDVLTRQQRLFKHLFEIQCIDFRLLLGLEIVIGGLIPSAIQYLQQFASCDLLIRMCVTLFASQPSVSMDTDTTHRMPAPSWSVLPTVFMTSRSRAWSVMLSAAWTSP